MGKPPNTVNCMVCTVGGGSAAGGAAPLSYGEETRPTAVPRPQDLGPVAGFKGLRPTAGQRPVKDHKWTKGEYGGERSIRIFKK